MRAHLEFREAIVGMGISTPPKKLMKRVRTKAEIKDRFTELKDQVKADRLKGKYFIHICNHRQGSEENRPCRSTPILADSTVTSIEDKLTVEGAL